MALAPVGVAWLSSALALLRTVAFGGPGRALVTGAVGGEVLENLGVPFFRDGEGPKRRRRRRALTASDRADIAFIASIISKAEAGRFATIIATRAR